MAKASLCLIALLLLISMAYLKSAGNIRNLWLMLISFTNNYALKHEKLLPCLHSHICSINYFRKTVANQNIVEEDIKDLLNLENDLYNSVHNILSSGLLPEN
jgi:hypothetical protein